MNNVKSFVCGFVVGVTIMGISACDLAIKHGDKQWFNGFRTASEMHELKDELERFRNEREKSEKRWPK